MHNGYIALHRKLLDNPIFDNPALLKMWVWCLLKATHTPYKQIVGLEVVDLNKGQFITGRFAGSNELKINESTWYKHMKLLEDLQMITLSANNKFTLVTVENWGVYQLGTEKNNNGVTTGNGKNTAKTSKTQNKDNNQITADNTITATDTEINETEKEQQNNNKITTKKQRGNTNNNVNNDNNKECAFNDEFVKQILVTYRGKKSKSTRDKKLPKILKEHSQDEILKAINNYNSTLKEGQKDYILNESTFWNGRYIDFLDENFKENKIIEQSNQSNWRGTDKRL